MELSNEELVRREIAIELIRSGLYYDNNNNPAIDADRIVTDGKKIFDFVFARQTVEAEALLDDGEEVE